MKLIYTALAVALMAPWGAWAATASSLVATPGKVNITAPGQKLSISLTRDGKPVEAASVTGYTFNVEKHTYEFMITLEKHDGKVIISPTERAESGEYELTIKTKYGDALVAVHMPLDEDPASIESRAKARGVSVDEMMRQEGLLKPVGPAKVTFQFPASYRVGDTMRMETPCPVGSSYEWTVNGLLVMHGEGPEQFEYTFTEAGDCVFEYREIKDGKTAAEGKGTATVLDKKK